MTHTKVVILHAYANAPSIMDTYQADGEHECDTRSHGNALTITKATPDLLLEDLLRITEAVLRLAERIRSGRSGCVPPNVAHSHPTLGGHLFRLAVVAFVRLTERIRDRFHKPLRFFAEGGG